MKKLTLSVCLIATTLGGLVATGLPVSAATSVKKQAKPVLEALNTSQETELAGLEKNAVKEPLAGKRLHQKPTLMKVPTMLRAEQTLETFLDSVVTSKEGISTSKTVYDYDQFGHRTLTATLVANTVKATWDTTSMTVNQYNEAGYITLNVSYGWDNMLEKPLPIDQTVSQYGVDGNNNLTMTRIYNTWNADSAKWLESEKQEVVFMGQQNQVYQQMIEYWYVAELGWEPYHKLEQYENVEGYSLVTANYEWVDSLQKWVGTHKRAYLYDEAEVYVHTQSYFEWSIELDRWYRRTDDTLLSDGRIESSSRYQYDVANQTWNPIDRNVYDYDGDQWFDQLTISQHWDPGTSEWVNDSKTGGEYNDVMGETSRYVRYDWDQATGEWKGITYWSKEWDDAGNLQAETRYEYTAEKEWAYIYNLWAEYDNLTEGEWLITTWMESEYNVNGYRTSYTQMYRDNSLSPWYDNFTYKQTFQFNEEGLRLNTRTYVWDDSNKVWTNYWKRDFTINEAGDYAYNIYYEWNVTDWVEKSRTTYFYSQKLVGVQAIQVKVDVYPNPVADRLVIKGAAKGEVIKVCDLNGRVVRVLKADADEASVSMANVPSGIYLVQVGKQVVKIVK
jgi:hypothetical protein